MHVLVVDDDPLAGEMTAAVLEELGHRVTLAENGADAMERLDGAPPSGSPAAPDLIVCDMNMPLVSGLELFRILREQGVALPFILLTGDDPEPLRRQQPDLDGCLMKDFSLDTTLAAAIAALRPGRPEV